MTTEQKRDIKIRYREPERLLTPEEEQRKARLMAYLDETSQLLMRWAAELQDENGIHRTETAPKPEGDGKATLPVPNADAFAWPHHSGQKTVNLKKMIWEHELEIRVQENQMVNADRPKFRRCRAKRDKFQAVWVRLKEARFAAENWENYFLMFREDEKLRRTSWMDSSFYQLERQDIEKKLKACNEFCLPVEKRVLQSLSKQFDAIVPEEPDPSDCLSEFRDEIHWYAIGYLFLEQYL